MRTWGDFERTKKVLRDAEVIAESDPAGVRIELVQMAAVAVQIIEAIDRRKKGAS